MNAALVILLALCAIFSCTGPAFALSSSNIPLGSPIYLYLEKLSGFGLISADLKGIRPYSKSEGARLLLEAEERLNTGFYPSLAHEMVAELRKLLPREAALYDHPESAPSFDITPLSSAKLRYVYLDGAPRSYSRPVHDSGDEGVFGIGGGLRPSNPYPSPVLQRGGEGTPLLENNEGIVYRDGSNLDLRLSSEAHVGRLASFLLEPMLLWSEDSDEGRLRLNKGYLKIGGGEIELEVGRDENWLGLGYRGAITLSNNARNFDLIKISSPEPVTSRYLWDLKYAIILSQFERSVTDGEERRPLFLAAKLSMKPTVNSEFGFNLGRQVAGRGVDNGAGETIRGLIGGFNRDNSNSLAGFELRFRLPFLRYSEIYGEFSGEDSASAWPIAESYLAGFFIPRLTQSGRDDFRFEYFHGNEILYTNMIFPQGYVREGLPVGHSQGGATREFFLRYSYWFSPRNNLALECFRTTRGDIGRVRVNAAGEFDPNGAMQAVERKVALRFIWTLPVLGDWNSLLSYGAERIHNVELRRGEDRTNHLLRAELSYQY